MQREQKTLLVSNFTFILYYLSQSKRKGHSKSWKNCPWVRSWGINWFRRSSWGNGIKKSHKWRPRWFVYCPTSFQFLEWIFYASQCALDDLWLQKRIPELMVAFCVKAVCLAFYIDWHLSDLFQKCIFVFQVTLSGLKFPLRILDFSDALFEPSHT